MPLPRPHTPGTCNRGWVVLRASSKGSLISKARQRQDDFFLRFILLPRRPVEVIVGDLKELGKGATKRDSSNTQTVLDGTWKRFLRD